MSGKEMATENFDEILRRFKQMRDAVRKVDRENTLPIDELFPVVFMREYTEFESIEAMFEACPWAVEDEDDLEDVPDDAWDAFVKDHTAFNSWRAMRHAGVNGWAKRKMGL